MAIYFDRSFNKTLRGYNTEEVDSALDAIILHCEELESANKEFAEENNRLIDENTLLKSENERLSSEFAELSEKLQKVEETYNTYRQKYGESRDMIVRAQKSSFEIVSEANEKAATIVAEAQNKSDTILSEIKSKEDALTNAAREERQAIITTLDSEIDAKTRISQKLENDFIDFKASISDDIATIMAILKIRDIKKTEIKDTAPKAQISPSASDVKPITEQKKEDKPPVSTVKSEEKQEPAPTPDNNIEEIEEIPEIEHITPKKIPDVKTDVKYIPFDKEPEKKQGFEIPVPDITPVQRPNTEFSKVKSALDGINDKVKNNKSTPHIN